MKHGPVDVIVLALGQPQFDGSILLELEKQTASGTIRVLDAMVLYKTETGECLRVDIEDMSETDRLALKFGESATFDLFDSDDAETLWEGMVPDSAVIALAIEHVWALELIDAIENNGVEVAMSFRVPAPIIDEAFALLETSQ